MATAPCSAACLALSALLSSRTWLPLMEDRSERNTTSPLAFLLAPLESSFPSLRCTVSLLHDSCPLEVICSVGVDWGRVPSCWGRSFGSRDASEQWLPKPWSSPGSSLDTRWGWQLAHPALLLPRPQAQPLCCSAASRLRCFSASSAVMGGLVVVSVCQVI